MKLNLSRKWFEEKAKAEEGCDVTAGVPDSMADPIEVFVQAQLSRFIDSMHWSPETGSDTRTLVLGNLRGFAVAISDALREDINKQD